MGPYFFMAVILTLVSFTYSKGGNSGFDPRNMKRSSMIVDTHRGIYGTVKNVKGNPIKESLYGKVTNEYGDRIKGAVIKVKSYRHSGDEKEIKVDRNGEYSTMLTPGLQYIVTASAPKYRSYTLIKDLTKNTSVEADFQLAFLPSIYLHGRIVDREENPVDQAVIKVSGQDKEIKVENGHYCATVLQGRYNVTVSAPGYTTQKESVDLCDHDAQINFELNFVLKKNRHPQRVSMLVI